MKGLLVISLTFIYGLALSQPVDRKFAVDITEFAMFFDYKYYINSDSIYIVKKTYLPKESRIRYTYKWTKKEKEEIDRLAHQINVEKLKSKYQAENGVDDNSEFSFHFALRGIDKKITVYNYKIAEILKFVEGVNNRLPDEYKIGYTKEYFSR